MRLADFIVDGNEDTAEMDQARNLMLGMLGHDMRSPLQAIQNDGMSNACSSCSATSS